jgi:micrococcal nuclease
MKYISLLFLFISFNLYSQSGTVVRIKDGDTIVVLDELNNQITIRLAEVDCPESNQPFGKKAKQFTTEQVALKNVTYKIVSIDRYGRTIGKVFYDGKYLSEEIIKNGFGWHYKKYSTSLKLSGMEQNAQNKKMGLWIDKNPTAPWNFRKKLTTY